MRWKPAFAIVTGFISGIIVILGSKFLELFRIDDVVGAVSVHGFAGAWGTLAAGIFLQGNMFDSSQIMIQAIGIIAAFFWAFPVALLMYFLIDKIFGLRVDTLDEQRGLDYTEHYEIGYPEFQTELIHKGKA